MKHIVEGMLDEFQVPASSEGGQLSPAQMKAILKAVHDNVSATLDKFSADKTGKADFALESAGWIGHRLSLSPMQDVYHCQVVVLSILVVLQHMTVATRM